MLRPCSVCTVRIDSTRVCTKACTPTGPSVLSTSIPVPVAVAAFRVHQYSIIGGHWTEDWNNNEPDVDHCTISNALQANPVDVEYRHYSNRWSTDEAN